MDGVGKETANDSVEAKGAPKNVGLMWFRSDLRVVDNTALIASSRHCNSVLAVFVSTPPCSGMSIMSHRLKLI